MSSSPASSSTTCSDIVCSICLDTCSVTSFADGCLHKFCGRCIFEWAQRSQLCPICRTFFANIITNVTSDTEYEVIPLEERRVPVANFARDSWWSNNFSRNRNIFAVRQFHSRSNQFPTSSSSSSSSSIQQQQSTNTNIIQSAPVLTSSPSQPISRASERRQETDQFIDSTTRRMEDVQIDNQPRPRRINWSHRYSQRQFFRHQPILPEPDQPQPQIQPQQQPSQPQPIPNYYDRAQNQFVNDSRNSFNSRPLRPLVGVRQDNHSNQHHQQHQHHQHHQHHHQPYQHQHNPNHHHHQNQNHHQAQSHHHHNHLNSNYHLSSSQSHLPYGPNQHYSNHIHPHPHHGQAHSHPHFNSNSHSNYPNQKRIFRSNDRQRRR